MGAESVVMLRESMLETSRSKTPVGEPPRENQRSETAPDQRSNDLRILQPMRRRGFLKGLGAAAGAGSAWAARDRFARAAAGPGKIPAGLARLRRWPATLHARLARFEDGHLAKAATVALDARATHADLDGASWTCSLRASAVKGSPDATDLLVTFRLVKGTASNANVGVVLMLDGWSKDDYLLLPGACYNGNRFESRHVGYPALLAEPADIGPNVPTIISDVPRLNVHPGPSRVELLAGDLTTPAVAAWSRRGAAGVILLTDQTTPFGDVAIAVEETDGDASGGGGGGASGGGGNERTRAILSVSAPGVRQDRRYALGNTRAPSRDEGAAFTQGAEVVLRLRLYLFDCPEVQGLFDRFVTARKDLSGPGTLRHTLPFSAAASLHEEKYNRQNWVEKPGYYATTPGPREGAGASEGASGSAGPSAGPSWQTGWGGGLIATHPLLFGGDAVSRERALRTIGFVFEKGQARSGFFHAASDGRSWLDEGAAAALRAGAPATTFKHARSWHLVRRSGDVLYFMLKQVALLELQDPSFKARESWTTGLTACADAFRLLWDRHHQLGQFVNVDTGQIAVGGSTSAAIVPAALALASLRFKNDDYLRVAVAAAETFHQRYVRAGLTSGGPPDALQCPDSESAAGLLEAFVVLFETTGDRVWIDRAADVAHQLATWQISYDFRFPARSTFARMDVQTTGAVVANAQNKNGAPGFFLSSGDALLKLYRATGRTLYLELLRDTAHNVTQYLNRPEHLFHPRSEPGWTCGRVNTGDATEPVGETTPWSSPHEICGMLTAVEVPGLYVQPDTGFVFAFDHVDARVREKVARRLVVAVTNPTAHEAAVRVLAENDAERTTALGQNPLWGARVVTLAPGETQDVEFARGEA